MEFRPINPKAAAIDVGSEQLHVAIVDQAVEVFETFTDSLHAVRDCLLAAGVETVAMEATPRVRRSDLYLLFP